MKIRTHLAAHIPSLELGSKLTLSGWIQSIRDHGGVFFIDLRDHSGYTQITCDAERADLLKIAESFRSESVIQVSGVLRLRPEGTENPKMLTGKLEVVADSLKLLSLAAPLAFPLEGKETVREEVRLEHRVLDLRGHDMQHNIRSRSRITQAIRRQLEDSGFLEIETPILTKATPEGARDYLVPSRTYPGSFFALPQSPQLFKQMLVMSGFEKYYQIARCFRDEDLRADRQPEFTQVDIEMGFCSQEDVMQVGEDLLRAVFKDFFALDLPAIPVMTYQEALSRFACDKPDLRIPLELVEIKDLVKDIDFKVFSEPAKLAQSRVCALKLPQGAKLVSRGQINQLTEFVKKFKAKGLAYIRIDDLEQGREGCNSPILKFFPDEVLQAIFQRLGAETGDMIFFGADKASIVNQSMHMLMLELADMLGLRSGGWKPLWVVDFPLFEKSEDGALQAMHHPFTKAQGDSSVLKNTAPSELLASAYDLVLNGVEIGGGSLRIYDYQEQCEVFRLLGIEQEEAEEKFNFLLTALKTGAPPHGGIAFGLDRLVMLMLERESIREVIPFPKTQSASCPLTKAPSSVSNGVLGEYGLILNDEL